MRVLVVGAGPGGLACARDLARGGCRVTVLERKAQPGPKVCAGGITWSGLIRRFPESLIERAFCGQHVVTAWQHTVVRSSTPIVATVDRARLGRHMLEEAREAGARLRPSTWLLGIDGQRAVVSGPAGRGEKLAFDALVGADGSASTVRRHLGLPCRRMGVGLDLRLPGSMEHMEWHLRPRLLASGYAWIFPHAEQTSVGAYADRAALSPARLRQALYRWAKEQGIDTGPARPRSGLISFDFQGLHFGRIHLAGDAAGLASGLTGEGIYPAIISGEAVARRILGQGEHPGLARLLRRHARHRRILDLAARGPWLRGLLMEFLVLLLRLGVINFQHLEMGA